MWYEMYDLAMELLIKAQKIRESDYQGYLEGVWTTYESCAALILSELGYKDYEISMLIFYFNCD